MSEERQVARRAGLVGSATLLARVPGLVRGQGMASWFGARFAAPALAPAFLNFLMIVVGLGLIPVCTRLHQPPILAMAVGVVAGGLGQFVWQLPPLWRLGFRLRWERPRAHPGVRRVALMMV